MKSGDLASLVSCGRKAIAVAVALSLAGCPTPTRNRGVTRSAELTAIPSMECVRQVIGSTPGVVDVEYRQIRLGDIDHVFRYRGDSRGHIVGELRFLHKADGTVHFDNFLLDYNSPPQTDIDATRPVMRQIEQAIADQCGIPSLPSRIQEECRGVDCA